MHITGGLGAVHGIEGFGAEYELPNKEAYNETCAAVGNVLFNHRMFLEHRDAKYMDVAEVALFNNSLAGMNLNGNKFFYVNPLEADGTTPFNHGKAGRSPWFDTACCPSNLARLLPQVSGMMYAHTGNEIFITLYASNKTEIELDKGKIKLHQTANYPFDGTVVVEVNPEREQEFAVKMRIPTWLGGQFVPGSLYHYTDGEPGEVELMVNGLPVELEMDKGFAVVNRSWKPMDTITLKLPMPVKFNEANELVTADRDRVAITKGPLVYCAEGVDNNGAVQRFFLDTLPSSESTRISLMHDGLLQDIPEITLPAKLNEGGKVQDANLILIPYYAWNNRGDSSMMVWFPGKLENP
jgi:DUF1680 family protein